MNNVSKKRLVDIDKAKGFAIFLVVAGHIVSGYGKPPADNEWFQILTMGIYKFHMPFFMYLSGLIFYYTYPNLNSISGYIKYVIKKLRRLSFGYIFFASCIYLGKTGLSSIIHVDRVPANYYSEIYNLLFMPQESAGGSLWFIYVLMEMYIVFPLLLMLKTRSIILLALGLVIYFLAMPHIFLLDRFVELFLFFALGIFVTRHYDQYLKFIDRYLLVLLALFALSFLAIPHISHKLSILIIGLCSLPALHSLLRNKFFSSIPVWGVLGTYTYSIYLMNTIFIGITKGVTLKLTTWDGLHFLIIGPILLLSGIYLPIFIKKYIFVKLPILDRATA